MFELKKINAVTQGFCFVSGGLTFFFSQPVSYSPCNSVTWMAVRSIATQPLHNHLQLLVPAGTARANGAKGQRG